MADARIFDTIRIRGGEAGWQVTLESILYGALDEKPVKAKNAPAGTPVIRRQTMTATLNASGESTLTTEGFDPTKVGHYTFDTNVLSVVDAAGDPVDYELAGDQYGVPSESGFLTLWAPKVTTRTSQQLITGPTDLTDTVMVSGGQPGAEFDGVTTLYGPFDFEPGEDFDLTADGVPVIGTSTFSGTYDAAGAAEVTSTPQHVTAPGVYVWSEQLTEIPDVTEPTKPAKPKKPETTLSVNPKIATKVTSQKVLPGATISDTFTAEGLVPEVAGRKITYTVTGALYGPVKGTDGSCEAVDWTDAKIAVEIDEFEIEGDENGKAEISGIGKYTVADTLDDCYTYGEELTATIEPGNGIEDKPITWTHKPGQESQTTITTQPNPKIATKVTSQKVLPGATISDTFTAEGLVPEVGGEKITYTVTGALYGPVKGADGSCEAVDWTDAPVAKTIEAFTIVGDENGQAEISGIGEMTVPDEPNTLDDCYTYGEELTATIAGHNKPITWTHEPGQESQTTIVTRLTPKIATQITAQKVLPGHTISDTFTAEGLVPEVGGEKITYTVTGALYGPVKAVETTTCDLIDWTDAPVAKVIEPFTIVGDENGKAEISGIGTFTVPDATEEKDNCYTYSEQLLATIAGHDKPITWTHEPGKESQTTIVQQPQLSTQVTSAVVTPGAEIADTIKVWDTAGAKASIDAIFYGYVLPEEGASCTSITDAQWRDLIDDGEAVEIARQTLTTQGDVEVTTAPFVVGDDAVGCGTWYEEAVFEGSESSTIKTPLGVITETTLVVAPVLTSEITGFSDGGQVEFGTEVSDSIFLDGVATRFVPESDELITATASGVLAGPLERNSAGTCEGLDWSKAKTVATYDDVVVPDTDKVEGLLKTKLTESGCYSASSTVELTHGDTVIATASHELGDPTQTVFVKRSSGGKVNTGDVPSLIAGNPGLIAALGVVGLALIAGAAWIVRRRKA
jgi:hypothetical protein